MWPFITAFCKSNTTLWKMGYWSFFCLQLPTLSCPTCSKHEYCFWFKVNNSHSAKNWVHEDPETVCMIIYISHQALWSCWDYTKSPESFPGKWAFAFYRIFAVIFLLSLIYNFVYFLDMNTDIWGEEIADCKYIFLWQSHPSNLCWPYEYLGS